MPVASFAEDRECKAFSMEYFSKTDIGRKREVNQDYVFATDQPIGNIPNLLIVADGMGGHKAGDFASKYTTESVVESLKQSTVSGPQAMFEEAISKANTLRCFSSSAISCFLYSAAMSSKWMSR